MTKIIREVQSHYNRAHDKVRSAIAEISSAQEWLDGGTKVIHMAERSRSKDINIHLRRALGELEGGLE
jgi:hypothetical protein